jgi:hypothetical protein
MGCGHTIGRAIKYLGAEKINLLPKEITGENTVYSNLNRIFIFKYYLFCQGKSFSKISSAAHKKLLKDAFIHACINVVHLTSMKSALLAPFLEFLNPSSGSSNSSASANSENNNIANKVALMAHCLVDEQFTAL